mmetsp:Transcript_22481/g.38332  ORF Transcript_22481/g.38332 Transcript_22481/m.38332 type:complete len:340 (-) Transcript_22481:143-1162(-)
MNLKILILCINAVAATSHNHHLRQKREQHDIVFRATKSQLRRLFKGGEEAQELEALRVLRGSRTLGNVHCDDVDDQGLPVNWTCDRDTEECGNHPNDCKTECDEEEDCHGHGECHHLECECDEGYEEDDDCGRQDVVYTFNVVLQGDEARTAECIAALDRLATLSLDNLSLPSTVSVNSKSRRSLQRRLTKSSNKSEKGALEIEINIVPTHDCSEAELAVQALENLDADAKLLDGDEVDSDDDLPAPYVCLVQESEDILKDAKKEKDAEDLEEDLDGLINTCNVTGIVDGDDVARCASDCHDDIEDDCEDELDPDEEDENDCGGLHNDLKHCYKKCYGL